MTSYCIVCSHLNLGINKWISCMPQEKDLLKEAFSVVPFYLFYKRRYLLFIRLFRYYSPPRYLLLKFANGLWQIPLNCFLTACFGFSWTVIVLTVFFFQLLQYEQDLSTWILLHFRVISHIFKNLVAYVARHLSRAFWI